MYCNQQHTMFTQVCRAEADLRRVAAKASSHFNRQGSLNVGLKNDLKRLKADLAGNRQTLFNHRKTCEICKK